MTDKLPIPRIEFVALCAMMFATIAFSIDAMLPALPDIGAELSPLDPNRAQLILTSFVLGMGVGTFFTGPLSDALGRKPVVIGGAVLYTISAAMAWQSQSLELVLLARFFQGIGAAGPRIVTLAIIRDLMSGREMARLVSIVMMVFTIVPAVAPTLGAGIIAVSDWRGVFLAFILFSAVTAVWLGVRLPEPLPREKRRPFRIAMLFSGLREMMGIPMVVISIIVQTLSFAMLLSLLSSVQQIYDITFDRGHSFHLWFGGIALVSGTASILNAALVMRLGMRFLVTATLGAQIVLSSWMLVMTMILPEGGNLLFACFVVWQTGLFFQAGMTLGNLNAMAMEPLGHMAGTAASVMGAISTVVAAVLAIPVGLAFDDTPLPLAVAVAIAAAISFVLMLWMKRLEAQTQSAQA